MTAVNGTNGTASPLRLALAYLDRGLSVLPVARDGSKRPDMSRLPREPGDDGKYHATWEPFKVTLPGREQVTKWFSGQTPSGIGIIGGAVSGGLECIDFDAQAETIFPEWSALVEASAPGLVLRLSVARTPKGYHVRYQCRALGEIPGNTKLASDPAAPPDARCLIETRGEGGYAIAPGSPLECHKSGLPYSHHSGPPLELIENITPDEREILIRTARSFDLAAAPEPSRPRPRENEGLSPGDDYEQRGPSLDEILVAAGWEVVHRRGDVLYLKRPGKEGRDWGATLGSCKGRQGEPLLHVFSSNAHPFEQEKTYGKFRAYALLHHNGSLSAAAKALAAQGFGEQRGQRRTSTRPATSSSNGEPAKEEAGDVHLTDVGNARRIIHRHGPDMRFWHACKTWLIWSGSHWREDETGEAVRRVKETQGYLFRQAANEVQRLVSAGDDERRDRLPILTGVLKHCQKWEDARAVMRSLEMAKSEPGIPILASDLDRDPWLLNVKNGTVDLRTGRLREHRREDLLTKLSPVIFDPDARCPRWLSFLNEIMLDRPRMVTYLQRVVGYSLTGTTTEQALWFLYGSGANGKSVFLSILLALLGPYGMQAVADLLMVKRHESHPTERADLFGKRFVTTIETDQGQRIAESLMKQLTGSDKIRARWLNRDFFEFEPTHKIFLAANHKPQINGTDHALWRRIKLVPFEFTVPEQKKDKALHEKLRAELSGILAWAVRGCLDWQRHGLDEPEEVRVATEHYRDEQDNVQAFLAECCILQRDARSKSSELLDAYYRWSGDRTMTGPAFRKCLQDKGFETKRGHGGCYFWHGVAIDQTRPMEEVSGGISE